MSNDLKDVLNEIAKKYGDGAIFKLGEKKKIECPAYSTGILGLDNILGVGGFPEGRITEIIGDSGSGKTSLCLAAIADAQKQGVTCAIVDAEHALDIDHANLLGVNVDDLFVSQPDDGNQALSVVKTLIESGKFGLVVVDSIAALTPMQEVEQEDFGSANIGLHARLMSQAMRKLSPLVSKNKVALLMTNQLRANIGAMGHAEQKVPTGGNAVKFFSGVRLELKRLNQIKDSKGEEIIGHKMSVKTLKNKVYRPYLTYEYNIYYGTNNVQFDEVLDLGVEAGLIKKGGAWLTYGDVKWQGSANARQYLLENQDVFIELRDKIKEFIKR